MSEVKSHAAYDEIISKVRSRKILIDDELFCKQGLARIGYYRLSAYFLPFKRSDKPT